MQIKPGIYSNLCSNDYHGHHGSYSKSSLADFSVYPYNMIYQRQNRVRDTKFDLGTASHTAILEPDKFKDSVVVCPPELLGKNGAKSTNAYKAWIAEQPNDKAALTQEEYNRVLRCRDAVFDDNHSTARDLLTGGLPEVSCFWEEQFHGEEKDDDTGYSRMHSDQYSERTDDHHVLTMKCRPDYIPGNQIIVDLKTTALPIDHESFERHAYSMKYHWSAGLTLRGLTIATGKPHRIYIFVVVEINPPHEVAVFRASEDFIALGKKEVIDTMRRLAWCDKHNQWPGAPNRIQHVGLPGWVMKRMDDR